jgi:phage tail-like protein
MNPYTKYRFHVNWGGIRIGFTEVSGLDFEQEAIEYREGSHAEISKLQIPGMIKYGTVSCGRGMVQGDNEFYEWFRATLTPGARRDVEISLLDEVGDPVFVWLLSNAFISKISSTDLKADGNEIAIEKFELKPDSISLSSV